MSRRYVEVSLAPPLARELTYGVPAALDKYIRPGSLVLVPVVRRMLTGVVLGDTTPSGLSSSLKEADIRDISQIVDSESSLDPEIIELCRWMATYYFAPIGKALSAALPPGLKVTSKAFGTGRRMPVAAKYRV